MKISRAIFPVLLIFNLIYFTGCSVISSSIYGMKSFKPRNEECIKKYADKYNISAASMCVLDTSYLGFIKNIDTVQKYNAKNHYQPLQVLYFDQAGNLISFHNNCHAGGFPNLKWNRDGILESFVPRSQIEVDSLMNFQKQLTYLRRVNGEPMILSDYDTTRYNVVVYWNVFMGRQSKRLIRFVNANCKLAQNEAVNILFVNNDQFLQHLNE